eukprot:gene8912-9000_t
MAPPLLALQDIHLTLGMLQPDRGSVFVQPGATVRYLPQEPDMSGFARVLDYVEAGMGPGDDAYRAVYLLEQLGMTGEEDPAHLSGGEARRAALARVLAPSPDILLLDEPTNHLDLPAIAWLEQELASLRSALVLISHDRRLLESLSRSIVWLDRGTARRLDRGFAHFEAWRDETLEQEERDRHKLGRKLAMEEDWLRYGVTARRKRNVKRLAGLHTLREQRKQKNGPTGGARLVAGETDLSGKLVAVAEDVSLSFGDRPIMVTLDQRRATLDPSKTLADTLTGNHGSTVDVNGQARHVIGYMKDFLFAPEQARTPGNGVWVEYAGGYSDMLAQRGKPAALSNLDAGKQTSKAAPQAKPAAPKKLSFKDKHALETLPRQIEKLNAEVAKQRRILGDPKLYARDRAGFDRATKALQDAETELAASEERWLELELLREMVEAG